MISPRPINIAIWIVPVLFLAGCNSMPAPQEARSNSTFVDQIQITESQPVTEEDVIVNQVSDEQYDIEYVTEIEPTEVMAGTIVEPDLQQVQDLWYRLRNEFELPALEGSEKTVAKFETWYSDRPKYFARLTDRAYWLLPYVINEVEKRGMPGEIAILPAVESAFRHEATSRSQAAGMWQFISSTGKRFGLRQDWWMDGRRDMVLSTRAALDYLEYLSREFNGDWHLALAAYNAGEGAIRRMVRSNEQAGKPTNYSALPLRKETAEYVPKLYAIRNIINDPRKYGIYLKSIPDIQTLSVIDARVQTDLTVAASLTPVSAKELAGFNKGYKRGVTPPNGPHHIVVPTLYADSMLAGLNKLSIQDRMRWARHQVRKGEYLGRIARKHGVSVEAIVSANKLDSNLIKPGQELKIPISTGHKQYARATVTDIEIQDGDKVYTVRKGDSLWKISRKAGIALQTLLNWNGIEESTRLFPGQQLVIGRSS